MRRIIFINTFLMIPMALLLVRCSVLGGEEKDSNRNAGAADFSEMPGQKWADPDEDASNEGDSYEDVGTNPFVMVEHDPFATFAADVDTASYDIFRRDIEYGQLPMPYSVRLEEYVNYFSYEYPVPQADSAHPFTVSMDAAPDIVGNGTTVLRIGIQGYVAPKPEKRPANLVFLVDTSGSMTSPAKLPLVKKVLTEALNVLDPTDKISIVSYAGDTSVRLEPTPVSSKSKIEKAINGLSSEGSTAGAAGITLAYKQASKGYIDGGINHVILCTDGDFNVGVSSDEALVTLIEEKRKEGVTLTVLGFGVGNLNDSMMEKVSNAGNGNYAVISSESHAERYVENRLLSNLVLIAKDMKIQVEFNPAHVVAYRLLGYENRAIADHDFENDRVDGGEIGSGHRVTALFEIVERDQEIPVPANAPPITIGDPFDGERHIDSGSMALVKVRYKDVDATESDEAFETSKSIPPSVVSTDYNEVDDDLKWAVAIAAFAEVLKESPYANPSALPAIEQIVNSKTWLDADRAEFASLFEKTLQLLDEKD